MYFKKENLLFCFLILLFVFSCSNNTGSEQTLKEGALGGTLTITATRPAGEVDSSHRIYLYAFDHLPLGPTDTDILTYGDISVNGGTITFIFNNDLTNVYITFFYDSNSNGIYDKVETYSLYLFDSIQGGESKTLSLDNIP